MKQRLAVLVVFVLTLGAIVATNRDAFAFAAARAAGTSPTADAARARLKDTLPALFAAHDVSWPPKALFLRAIKENADGTPGVVELWASSEKTKKSPKMTLIKSYPICALSGVLGPKRKQGDMQIPEGFYTISKLNPFSSYHLSLRVDYPNASDKIRGQKLNPGADLGGDIMAHGNCVTIGCIPLQDEPIEEVYVAAEAAFGKRPLPIHIFPRRLDKDGLQALQATTTDATLQAFWAELARGYQAFDVDHVVPAVSVDKAGAYVVAH